MKRHSILVLAVVLFNTFSANAVLYSIIDLGTLGEDRSHAYSINNNGQIVGYTSNSALNHSTFSVRNKDN